MKKLLGLDKDQAPRNADLGSMAYVDVDNAPKITANEIVARSYRSSVTSAEDSLSGEEEYSYIKLQPEGLDSRMLWSNGDGALARIHWDGGTHSLEIRTKGAYTYDVDGVTEIVNRNASGVPASPGTTFYLSGIDGSLNITNGGTYKNEGQVIADAGFLANRKHVSAQPTITFDFARAKTVPPGLTNKRNSKASFFNRKGYIEFADQGVPRITYDSVTGECLGILLEDGITNYQIYSNNFSQWDSTNAYHDANNNGVDRSLDGATTCSKLVPNNGTQSSWILKDTTFPDATTMVYSIYVKSGGFRYIQLAGSTGIAGNNPVNYDLETGEMGGDNVANGYMQKLGGGWWRIGMRITTSGTSGRVIVSAAESLNHGRLSAVTGDGVSGYFLYGAQMEASRAPTSYVETGSSSATRDHDLLDANTWLNRAVGHANGHTFLVEYNNFSNDYYRALFYIGGGSDRIEMWYASNSATLNLNHGHPTSGGTESVTLSGISNDQTMTSGSYWNNRTGDHIVVFSIDDDGNLIGCIDGETPVTRTRQTATDVASEFNTWHIGSTGSGSENLNSYIRRIYYYPKGLTAEECQILSTKINLEDY